MSTMKNVHQSVTTHSLFKNLPSNIIIEPLITSRCNLGGGEGRSSMALHQIKPNNSEMDGYPDEGLHTDLLIRGQHYRDTDVLVDVFIADLDSNYQV